MIQNIYALLVGINNYKSDQISRLKGCVNDINAIENYLTQVKSKTNIKKLINQNATRQGIIEGFEEHLSLANKGDIALFYFSGHGSQEPVPQEFKDIQPNGLIETLVCWDSRTEGSFDLADKELAVLINRIAQNNPQIIVILDCCHSGGAVRDDTTDNLLKARYIDSSKERSVSSFFAPEAIKALFAKYNSEKQEHHNFILPEGKYIFLSACRDSEKAFESSDHQRGIFSYFLTDTLQLANGNLSYQDLFNKTKDKVRNFSTKQYPQFEVSKPIYANLLFLGDSVIKRERYYTVTYNPKEGWVIDYGGVHGIKPSCEQEKTLLAIFPLNVVNISELDRAIAFAEVTQVLSDRSQIKISPTREDLDNKLNYKAIIANLPSPRLWVYLEGEEAGINLVRQALQHSSNNRQPSLYIKDVLEAETADLKLIARNNSYLIPKPDCDNFTLVSIDGYSPESSFQAMEILEHIAHWHNILNLSSDFRRSIPKNAVKITLYQENSQEIPQSNFSLEYQYQNGNWCPPRVQIELTNTSQIGLYCALLNLTELYGIKAFPLRGNSHVVYLKPGETVWVLEGKAFPVSIPDKFCQQGITKCKDILKLIVSNKDFDISLLEQPNIEETSRGMQIHPNQEIIRDSWVVNDFVIITTIPQSNPSEELNEQKDELTDSSNRTSSTPKKNKFQKVNYKKVLITSALITILSLVTYLFIGKQKQQQELDNRQQSKISQLILF